MPSEQSRCLTFSDPSVLNSYRLLDTFLKSLNCQLLGSLVWARHRHWGILLCQNCKYMTWLDLPWLTGRFGVDGRLEKQELIRFININKEKTLFYLFLSLLFYPSKRCASWSSERFINTHLQLIEVFPCRGIWPEWREELDRSDSARRVFWLNFPCPLLFFPSMAFL